MAEDSVVIQTVLREMLTRWGYQVVVAGDGAAAWDVLHRSEAPRLAIVDWMMPKMKGPELCRRLRAEASGASTYVLMLTARSEERDIVEGFRAGADDYLSKPFHAGELWARIKTGARIVRTQQELVEAREALRNCAGDARPAAPRGGCVLDALEAAQESTGRNGQPLSVLLVDIDRFTQIVDSFGRMVGDLVLRECAGRIRGAEPPSATSGRYSADEFLVLLPGHCRQQAAEAAERIRTAVGAAAFSAGAASFPMTCAIGVATREPGGTRDSATLLRAADEALLIAKNAARERVAGALRASAAVRNGLT